jgi:nucleotide-binding universal stress UspA family protein
MRTERIVVPLDFSDEADRALPVAQALADRLGARVAALVVTSPGLDPRIDRHEAQWHARRAGCRLDDVVLSHDDDVVADLVAVTGTPGTLLCLASSARGAVIDLVARSVSERVLCSARGPVLVVGPGVEPGGHWGEVRDLLCCVDDEPIVTDRLLAVTADWALALDCAPHLVRVVGPDGPEAAAEARESLDAVVRRLWARGVPATSGLVAADDTGGAIVRCARRWPGCAVVLASHGRSGLRRLALGSVTLDVLRRSPSPVLVIPALAALTVDPTRVATGATEAARGVGP